MKEYKLKHTEIEDVFPERVLDGKIPDDEVLIDIKFRLGSYDFIKNTVTVDIYTMKKKHLN